MNFENRLSFRKVIAIRWWSTFLGHSVDSKPLNASKN